MQYLPSGQIPAIGSGPHEVITTDVTWRAGCDMSPVGANIMSNNSPSLDEIQKRYSMGAFIPFSSQATIQLSWYSEVSVSGWGNRGPLLFPLCSDLRLTFPTEPLSWVQLSFWHPRGFPRSLFRSKEDFDVSSLRRLIEADLVS